MVGDKKHILVVDDDPLLVRLNKRQLENSGYHVSITTESSDVLQLLSKNPGTYHLLVTDLIMPGLSGRGLLEKVGTQYPDLPIVVLTGQLDRETEQELLALGAKAIVGKPVFGNELVAVIDRVLAEE